jgi:hypothetical protein
VPRNGTSNRRSACRGGVSSNGLAWPNSQTGSCRRAGCGTPPRRAAHTTHAHQSTSRRFAKCDTNTYVQRTWIGNCRKCGECELQRWRLGCPRWPRSARRGWGRHTWPTWHRPTRHPTARVGKNTHQPHQQQLKRMINWRVASHWGKSCADGAFRARAARHRRLARRRSNRAATAPGLLDTLRWSGPFQRFNASTRARHHASA